MYTYKGKLVHLLRMTHVWDGKQYCTILMENRLGRLQRQSVLFSHLCKRELEGGKNHEGGKNYVRF